MRYARIFTSVFCLLCTIVNGYAAEDQRRQYGEDRQRGVRPPVAPPVTPVQRPQPTTQQSTSNQRNNERSQNQRSGTNGGIVQGQQSQPQVVNIDRLKLQSDTPTEYQFEPLLTLSVQEGESSKIEDELKTEPVEAAAEELREVSVEEHVSIGLAVEEALDKAGPHQEQAVLAGNTQFRIIEESDRIIVTQIEVEPIVKGGQRAIQK